MRSLLLLAALLISGACAPSIRHVPFLTEADCDRTPINLTRLGGVRITGRCINEGAVKALHITVSNDAASGSGNLQAFSLAFCGNAISVEAPEGWISRFEGNPEPDVDFQIRDEAQSFSIPPNKALDGFVIRLSRGWRRKSASGATWDNGVAANVMTHDWCK
jgi:hypothetical protein